MAKGAKVSGGSDEQTDILRAIWNEMKSLNSRIEKTNERLDAIRSENRSGFEVLAKRIDNILTGEHGRQHQELQKRVERIEEKLPPQS